VRVRIEFDQCRRGADDGLGPQSRDLALDGAFQADECREPERGEKLDEVSAALRSAAQQRARRPDLHIRQT
jgi:hypothetical protein